MPMGLKVPDRTAIARYAKPWRLHLSAAAMTSQVVSSKLAELPLHPYLDEEGCLATDLQRQIGIYAIFDQTQTLQYVGYSRDVYQSLKQHLVRRPHDCWWYKLQTIERPSRTVLEDLKQAWIAEGHPTAFASDELLASWVDAIDAKLTMTEADKADYAKLDDGAKPKFLKKVARRLESQILEQLKARNVQMELRFNPKLKEQGLLDLK